MNGEGALGRAGLFWRGEKLVGRQLDRGRYRVSDPQPVVVDVGGEGGIADINRVARRERGQRGEDPQDDDKDEPALAPRVQRFTVRQSRLHGVLPGVGFVAGVDGGADPCADTGARIPSMHCLTDFFVTHSAGRSTCRSVAVETARTLSVATSRT